MSEQKPQCRFTSITLTQHPLPPVSAVAAASFHTGAIQQCLSAASVSLLSVLVQILHLFYDTNVLNHSQILHQFPSSHSHSVGKKISSTSINGQPFSPGCISLHAAAASAAAAGPLWFIILTTLFHKIYVASPTVNWGGSVPPRQPSLFFLITGCKVTDNLWQCVSKKQRDEEVRLLGSDFRLRTSAGAASVPMQGY